jgi:CoA:oxalate CoA-transferase
LAVSFEAEVGRALLKELVEKVDVVIENYSPGVMEKYGLDYASLKAIKPDLIMASVSGFGQDGPYAKQPSFDIVAQAQSGVMAMTGDPDGPPQYVGNYFGDPNAGVHAAFAVASALFHRSRTGEGQYIDVSQLESLVYIDYVNFPLNQMSNGEIKPHRFGGDFFNICPYGTYQAKQGYIVFAVAGHQWGPLVKAMGMPELEDDARFSSQEARCSRRPEVRAIIETWLAEFDDDETPLKILADARVPSAPILEIPEVPEHQQIKARKVYQAIEHPELGITPIARSPFRFGTMDNSIPFRAPYLGEHNEAILERYLGYSSKQIGDLYQEGVLVQDPKVSALGLTT